MTLWPLGWQKPFCGAGYDVGRLLTFPFRSE